MAGTLLTGVVLASALPLGRYYRYPKQDFRGAIREARELSVGPATHAVGVHLAEHVVNGFYDAGFGAVETVEDLIRTESAADTLVLVTTLEGLLRLHDPALHRRIRERYERVRYLPGTVGDGAIRIYRGPPRADTGSDRREPGREGDSADGGV